MLVTNIHKKMLVCPERLIDVGTMKDRAEEATKIFDLHFGP